MKKLTILTLVLALTLGSVLSLTSCDTKADYTVGVCQFMEHPFLDAATQGFADALNAKMEAAGKTVDIDVQIPASSDLCSTVIGTFTAKNVDLIMANGTPAVFAAGNATDKIPILGTSVTDYAEAFEGSIPANVSGTSDAVPFNEQAQMMIDTLGLVSGDKVGVIYCSNESNSQFQYEAVKAYFEAKGIVVTKYTFADPGELQAVASLAASESKAVYVPSDNTVASNETIVGTVCNEAKTPVYTSYGGTICYASLAIDYYALGVRTGEMAADILLGNKSISDIEIETLTPTVSYNEELCKALGITVPENSDKEEG